MKSRTWLMKAVSYIQNQEKHHLNWEQLTSREADLSFIFTFIPGRRVKYTAFCQKNGRPLYPHQFNGNILIILVCITKCISTDIVYFFCIS